MQEIATLFSEMTIETKNICSCQNFKCKSQSYYFIKMIIANKPILGGLFWLGKPSHFKIDFGIYRIFHKTVKDRYFTDFS